MIQFDAVLKSWTELLNSKGLARNSTAEPIDFKLVHNVIAKAIQGHVFIDSDSVFDVIILALIIKHFTKYERLIVLNNPNQTILKELKKFGLSHLVIDGVQESNDHSKKYHYCLMINNQNSNDLDCNPFGLIMNGKDVYSPSAFRSIKKNSDFTDFQKQIESDIFTTLGFEEQLFLSDQYKNSKGPSSSNLLFICYGNNSTDSFLWQYFWLQKIHGNKNVVGIYIDFVLDSKINQFCQTQQTLHALQLDANIDANLKNLFDQYNNSTVDVLYMEPSSIDLPSIGQYLNVFIPLLKSNSLLVIKSDSDLDQGIKDTIHRLDELTNKTLNQCDTLYCIHL